MPRMSNDATWCLIESDPGIFNELISGFGVTGVQVEELLSLDEDFFNELKPIYGLIFLFKIRDGDGVMGELVPNAPNVFFTQQIVANACATQAIINLLMNIQSDSVKLGTVLENFKSFTEGFNPADRGEALSNCDEVRSVHNSFARQGYVEVASATTGVIQEDVYHFAAYVPIGQCVYELDGLKQAPIKAAEFKTGGDWIMAVEPVLRKRIARYAEGDIHFNLMALVGDKKLKSEQRMKELMQSGMDSEEVGNEMGRLRAIIAEEDEKRRLYKIENNRRRHNYTPFIVELLKLLAREGKLVPLVEKAIEDAKTKAKKKGGR